MSDHGKEHGHHGHGHDQHGHHEHGGKEWRWHRDWRTWVAVILMLAAIVGYVLSDDESLQPGKPQQQEMPASALESPQQGTAKMSDEPDVLLVTRRFRVVRRYQPTADGTAHAREIIEHPGAVVIVPLVEAERVCLIRNYRIAVGETLWELPAGTLEKDEPVLETARRELIEETGYRSSTMEKFGELWMSPGILNERMHMFVATGLVAGPTALEAGEEIETAVVAWPEALAMIDRGEIRDAKTVAGLLAYDRIRRAS